MPKYCRHTYVQGSNVFLFPGDNVIYFWDKTCTLFEFEQPGPARKWVKVNPEFGETLN